jgi:enoyl-CoA hydratase
MISIHHDQHGICEIVIDRPPVNAFSIALLKDLTEAIWNAGSDASVRCILLRADGRGFSAGGDVKEVEALDAFQGILGQAEWSYKVSLALIDCPVPVLCAVHEYCIGVGSLIAAAGDILVAAKGTRFILAEVDNGATTGGVHALRLMPEKRARAAMMTAEPVTAEELHAFGSVLRVCEPDALAGEARSLAALLARKPRESMVRMKESFNNSSRMEQFRTLYRAELGYTFELNLIGIASEGRQGFITKDKTLP